MDYFTFEIDGKKCGYYVVDDGDGVFSSNAFIDMDGEQFENPFWIKHDGLVVTHFRFGDHVEWTPLHQYPAGTYPSSAIDLLIRTLGDGQTLRYDQLHEGSGAITTGVQLVRTGNRIEELIDGAIHRHVVVDAQQNIVEYGWGGTAISRRTSGRDEAIRGTSFACIVHG